MSFKKFIAESVDLHQIDAAIISNGKSIDKLKFEDFNKPTPYDWFIDYELFYEFASAREREYKRWMARGQNHPAGFMFLWLQCILTPNSRRNVLDPGIFASPRGVKDYEALSKFVNEDVIINGSTIRIMTDLEMWQYDIEGAAKIPEPPKLHMVSGYVDISSCSFDALPRWLPSIIGGTLRLRNNKNLTSLSHIYDYIKKCPKIDLSGTPITSHVLGLLKISDLKFVKFSPELRHVENIINKYLNSDENSSKKILSAQSEMLDNGLDDFAQL